MNDVVPVAEDAAVPAIARSLSDDAWHDLRRNPIFWIAAAIVVTVVALAAAPQLFSSIDPRTADCSLVDSMRPPSAEHWFGFDKQGCDVYSRVVHGARASTLVGIFSTILAGSIALAVGLLPGFYGLWVDAVRARCTDVMLGVPLLRGAIVFAKALATQEWGIWPVVLALGLLGFPQAARVMRSSVIAARQQ